MSRTWSPRWRTLFLRNCLLRITVGSRAPKDMMIRRGWYTTLQLTVRCVLAPNFDKYATKLDLFTLFKYNKTVDKELFYVLLGGLQILRKVLTDKELQCLRCNCFATSNYQAFGLTCVRVQTYHTVFPPREFCLLTGRECTSWGFQQKLVRYGTTGGRTS